MDRLHNTSSLFWIIGGVFNEIVSSSEKEGGVERRQSLMQDFREAIDLCGLTDVGNRGDDFTWCDRRYIATNLRKT